MTKQYKLIHFYHDVDQWELFDLSLDPHELNNVYDQTSYEHVREQLKQELIQLRLQYKDSPELEQEFIKRAEQWVKNKNRKPRLTH